MNATYSVDFHSANARHESATDIFLMEMNTLYPNHVYKRLEGLNDQGCDLVLTVDGHHWNVEIKTLSGASSKGSNYPTFCVEMFTDYAQTHRTDWRVHSDYIIFINMATSTAHLYDSAQLEAWCSSKTLKPSGTGTGQYGVKNKLCSWVVCVPWVCKEAGHVLDVKLGGFHGN